jgi:hypothetical protein
MMRGPMKRPSDEPDDGNDVSLSWLIQSILRGTLAGLRRNKLAAALAGLTAVFFLLIAINYRLDGLHDYQQFILPRLLRLESGFSESLRASENASGDLRAYYFENAHRQVGDILRVARLDRPKGDSARARHRKFIQYYEAVNLEFYTIGMQARVDPNIDYVARLRMRMEELKPIRDSWASWAIPGENGH